MINAVGRMSVAAFVLLLAAASLIAVAERASGQTTTDKETPHPATPTPLPPAAVVSVTGTWEGTLKSLRYRTVPITIRLRQKDGGVVEGNYDYPMFRHGRGHLTNIPLSGTVSEDGQLILRDLTLPYGGITATVIGNKMTGRFSGHSGALTELEAERKE